VLHLFLLLTASIIIIKKGDNMNFKQLKNQIKQEQKQLAIQIRTLKQKRKKVLCGYVQGLDWKRQQYRYKHIAYCQFFNKTSYEQIESSCNEKPNIFIINKYLNQWYAELENVCYNS
jgi:hypothetical protein